VHAVGELEGPAGRQQGVGGLTAAADLADPQCEAAEDQHPQPAGGEFGVHTSDTVTEQQVAVQVVEGGLQRWGAHQVWSAPRTCVLGRDDRCSPAGTVLVPRTRVTSGDLHILV
jgi:hypothetical protein